MEIMLLLWVKYLEIHRRPLKDRKNVVISRTLKETINNVYFFSSIEKGIQDCIECDEIWLIGGRQIYEYCLNNINIDSLVVTYIDKDIECVIFLILKWIGK